MTKGVLTTEQVQVAIDSTCNLEKLFHTLAAICTIMEVQLSDDALKVLRQHIASETLRNLDFSVVESAIVWGTNHE